MVRSTRLIKRCSIGSYLSLPILSREVEVQCSYLRRYKLFLIFYTNFMFLAVKEGIYSSLYLADIKAKINNVLTSKIIYTVIKSTFFKKYCQTLQYTNSNSWICYKQRKSRIIIKNNLSKATSSVSRITLVLVIASVCSYDIITVFTVFDCIRSYISASF